MHAPVDRDGRLPLYHQVAIDLEQRIATGEWQVGSRMSSETELAEEYEVSRMTIRQALGSLEQEGIIIRKRPSGTFVARLPHKIAPTIGISASFVESLNSSGYASTAETLSITVMATPTPEVMTLLRGAPRDQYIQYDRLVTANGSPLAWARSTIPYSRFPGLENYPLKNNSIHATIEERFGASATSADHWLEAEMASAEDVKLLGARLDRPILTITSVYYDQDELAIGHMTTRWLADVMKMHVKSAMPSALPVSRTP